MAKFSIVCLVVLAAALNVKAISQEEKDEIKAAMLVHFTECNKEFGVTDEEIKAAKAEKSFDKIDPCLIGCVLKRSGVVNEKGMFDSEKVTELSKKYLKSDEDQAKFGEIVKDCSKVNDEKVSDGEDGCERSKLVADCFAKHKDEVGSFRR